VLAGVLVLPASAPALEVSVSGGVLSVYDNVGQVNNVSIRAPDANGDYGIQDSNTITPIAPCRSGPVPSIAYCPGGGAPGVPAVSRMVVTLDIGNDFFTPESSISIGMSLYGGPGNDAFSGGAGPDLFVGGPGNDSFAGYGGVNTVSFEGHVGGVVAALGSATGNGDPTVGESDDLRNAMASRLIGGAGDDRLTGDGTANRLEGGAGDDRLDGGLGDDLLLGGAGSDTVAYATRANSITAHLGTASINGELGVGESDDLSDPELENVAGGEGGDVITGTGAANVLSGNGGSDDITGGEGQDVLAGGAGTDTLRSRDSVADTVGCGGDADTAIVDAADVVDLDCETTDPARPPPDGDPAGTPTPTPTPTGTGTGPGTPEDLPGGLPTVPRPPVDLAGMFAEQSKRKSPRALASDVTAPGPLDRVVRATQTALRRGGIAVADGGRVHLAPVGPSAHASVSRLEVLNLALEAQGRATAASTNLDELARRLNALGFPFKRAARPGVQLRGILQAWVRAAGRNRRDPRSFNPLFLDAMARRQVSPRLSLARANYRPVQLRLTALEVELMLAALRRVPAKYLRGVKPARARAAADPVPDCSSIVDELDKNTAFVGGSKLGAAFLDHGFAELGGKALNAGLTKGLKVKDAGQYTKALSLAGTALRLQKLAAIYGSVSIEVVSLEHDGSADSVHKPQDSANRASTEQYAFGALVAVGGERYEEYQAIAAAVGETATALTSAAVDCLGKLGIPLPTTPGDVAKAVDSWTVKWTLDADARDARYDFENSGFQPKLSRRSKLTRIPTSPNEAAARMVIGILPEDASAHPGEVFSRDVVVQADLNTAEAVNAGTIANTGKAFIGVLGGDYSGVADTQVQLLAGWLQSMVTPSATATLQVAYHKPTAGCNRRERATCPKKVKKRYRPGRSITISGPCKAHEPKPDRPWPVGYEYNSVERAVRITGADLRFVSGPACKPVVLRAPEEPTPEDFRTFYIERYTNYLHEICRGNNRGALACGYSLSTIRNESVIEKETIVMPNPRIEPD